jgi:hypothetical protein
VCVCEQSTGIRTAMPSEVTVAHTGAAAFLSSPRYTPLSSLSLQLTATISDSYARTYNACVVTWSLPHRKIPRLILEIKGRDKRIAAGRSHVRVCINFRID